MEEEDQMEALHLTEDSENEVKNLVRQENVQDQTIILVTR